MERLFLTGFPGFISVHYLMELVKVGKPQEVHLLIQSQMKNLAEEKLQEFRQKYPEVHFSLHEGDLTQKGLGLKTPLQVDSIHHLAAIYDLAVKPEIAHRINVEGTKNLIEWGEGLKTVRQYVYFSTCYVLGKGKLLKEEFIDHPGGVEEFHNHYEHTKWLAEELFREIPNVLIIRPSVVVGNSQTGKTEKYDGPYFVIRFLKKLGFLSLLAPNLGSDEIYVNTIPVDFLCFKASESILKHEKMGFPQTIANLADPNPPTTREYYAVVVKNVAKLRPLHLDFVRGPILGLLRVPGMSQLTGIHTTTLDYFNWSGKIQTRTVGEEEFPKTLQLLPKLIKNCKV